MESNGERNATRRNSVRVIGDSNGLADDTWDGGTWEESADVSIETKSLRDMENGTKENADQFMRLPTVWKAKEACCEKEIIFLNLKKIERKNLLVKVIVILKLKGKKPLSNIISKNSHKSKAENHTASEEMINSNCRI